jgi:hypothetical protein
MRTNKQINKASKWYSLSLMRSQYDVLETKLTIW